MNKLEVLIRQLCPDGVEYRPFGDMATIVRGASPRPIKNFITTREDGVNWIKIGDVKPGSKYITDTTEKITPEGAKKSRLVKEGDFILSNSMSFGRPYIMKTEGCIHDGWLAISNFDCYFISDFLYHLLNSNQYQYMMKQKASFGGAVQNLNADIVRELMMPVVPMEVQQEIVRILDQFTQLTAELTAELKYELTARKRQHKYHALSLINGTHDVKQVPLSCLGTWYGGCTPSMANPSFWANGNIPWVSSKDMKTPILTDTQNHLTTEALAQTPIKLFPKNTVAIVARSGILKHTLPVAFIPFETTVNQDIKVLVVSHGVEPRYIYHVLNANSDDILKKAKKQGGTVDSLDIKKFMEYTVPLPTLSEQLRIVSLLDRFDILYNDLTCKLTAEIEAHQKRYEYYRDKLLNFGELG